MARSSKHSYRKEARRSTSEYGSASAEDIARYGINRTWEKPSAVSSSAPQADTVAKEDSAPIKEEEDALIQGYIQGQEPKELAEAAVGDVVVFEQNGKEVAKVEKRERAKNARAALGTSISAAQTDAQEQAQKKALTRKVLIFALPTLVLLFLSLSPMGAAGENYGMRYMIVNPFDAVGYFCSYVGYQIGSLLGWVDFTDYYQGIVNGLNPSAAVANRVGVLGITLVCAVLLSVSGMLYQSVFKNPLAGPGMLGVSSGVTLGMMIMVYLYGVDASGALTQRYAWCYGLGAAVLALVILVGKKISGKGKPFDIMSMLLVGMILSQLVGFVTQYYTLFVMDPDKYQLYLTLSQMLVVDTSWLSWLVLTLATVVSLVPIILLRYRLNVLSFSDSQARLWGVNLTLLRAIALVCGAIMILAAQIHIGAVAMVSLIVPFLSRAWFGVEFREQLIGNICISIPLMLICRDLVDLIPFVGDGIGIGSAVSVFALPLFMLILARGMKGWD